MNATLTDALYSMEYLSLKMGAAITVGSQGIVLESITTAAANKITVKDGYTLSESDKDKLRAYGIEFTAALKY